MMNNVKRVILNVTEGTTTYECTNCWLPDKECLFDVETKVILSRLVIISFDSGSFCFMNSFCCCCFVVFVREMRERVAASRCRIIGGHLFGSNGRR